MRHPGQGWAHPRALLALALVAAWPAAAEDLDLPQIQRRVSEATREHRETRQRLQQGMAERERAQEARDRALEQLRQAQAEAKASAEHLKQSEAAVKLLDGEEKKAREHLEQQRHLLDPFLAPGGRP